MAVFPGDPLSEDSMIKVSQDHAGMPDPGWKPTSPNFAIILSFHSIFNDIL
jgi:hypothetical protein